MPVEDFRILMGDLARLEAERDALREVLDKERASTDEYMTEIDKLRKMFADEREAFKAERRYFQRELNKRWLYVILAAGLGYAVK